jgi:hypothetical protein
MLMKQNEKGQALLELIIFLPLMFTVYAIVTGFANAIYGSINQQKATRAYFYYRVQNNSTIPRRPPQGTNWVKYGTFFVGWREKVQDDLPYAPCYRISIPVANAADDSCDAEYTASGDDRPSTQFMRVGSVYGFCGATYQRNNNIITQSPNREDLGYRSVLDQDSCVISE